MKFLLPFILFLMVGCGSSSSETKIEKPLGESASAQYEVLSADETLSVATFAGGCFWCMEGPFESAEGVREAFTGFAGGNVPDPTYEQVTSGTTGHRESVQVFYDPNVINYEKLLEIYWAQIDPTDEGGQFADRGTHYTTAIFYHTDHQKIQALQSRQDLRHSEKFIGKIVTDIVPMSDFYLADEYHQDFYLHAAERYNRYKKGSGREDFIDKNWKDESKSTVVPKLSPLQYAVTHQGGTEQPFDNEFWDNKEPGIYLDILSGKPLFTSLDKFDSGTGWPSFTKPIDETEIETKSDTSLAVEQTEVRSMTGDSHLGHVFNDGPEEAGGQRFCINSAALEFVPVAELEERGFDKYLDLFK